MNTEDLIRGFGLYQSESIKTIDYSTQEVKRRCRSDQTYSAETGLPYAIEA